MKLTERQRQLLQFMADGSPKSAWGAAVHLGLTFSDDARKVFTQLACKGLAVRVSWGQYALTPAGAEALAAWEAGR